MRSNKTAFFIFSLPWVITLLLFWAFPILYSFLVGFTDCNLHSFKFLPWENNWIGLDNYQELFSDQDFIDSLKNTFIFVFGTIPVTTVLSLVMALLVSRRFKGRALFRAGYFMPSITSLVVISLIFINLFQRGGYVALLCEMVGIAPPVNGFLYNSGTALYSVMAMDIWMSVGYYMLIFLAGLKAIPEELYEVAEVNGASPLRRFFSITLPLLRPVALFIIVINSIKSFQVFVEIFVMTQGKFDTSTMVYFIYDTGLATAFRFGYASAAAYILFIIIAVFSLLQFILLRQRSATW